MIDPLSRHAEMRPDREALWTPDSSYSYAEFSSRVGHTARELHDRGVGARVRVGVHLPRSAEAVVLFWALWRVGAVVVPISTRLPASDVVQRARRVGCSMLVTDDSTIDGDVPDLPTFRPEALVDADGATPETGFTARASFSDNQPATIMYTSGSTGTPKAVLHTWGNHRYSAKGSNANIPLRSGDRWMLSLPLYHVGGLAILVRCALAGAAVAIPSQTEPLHEALRTTGATHVSFVATQLRRVLEATSGGAGRLRAVLLGGGPIPEALIDRATNRNWPIHTSYGSTEMASQVTTTRPGSLYDDLRTAGRCLLHRQLRIEDGEIHVKGETLCQGYVTDDGIEDVRSPTGWWPTGDRGALDAEGRLHVLGRMDRMFVSGGENIQPEEIESTLERLDQVDRAVVVPVPDEEFGARPVAFIEHAEGRRGTTLETALRERLPGFKIPDAFHSLPPEATSDGLKIDHELLRRRARGLHDV